MHSANIYIGNYVYKLINQFMKPLTVKDFNLDVVKYIVITENILLLI